MVELPGIEELGYGRIVCMDVVTRDDIALLYVEKVMIINCERLIYCT